MRILFCDDNPQILTQLQKYVAEFFKNFGVQCPEFAVYHTGDALIQAETKAHRTVDLHRRFRRPKYPNTLLHRRLPFANRERL